MSGCGSWARLEFGRRAKTSSGLHKKVPIVVCLSPIYIRSQLLQQSELLLRPQPCIPTMAAAAASPPLSHPFYPVELELANYVANEWGTLTLVSVFAAGCAVIFSFTYLAVMKIRPQASKSDLLTILWFVLCESMPRAPFNRAPIANRKLCRRLHPSLLRRLLFLQLQAHAEHERSFWAAMEGVFLV